MSVSSMSYGALWAASKDQAWCAKAFICRNQSSQLSLSREDGRSFPSAENYRFLSNRFILCILKVNRASWWAYHWSQRTASITEGPSQGPLVLQIRLIRITTKRIFLLEAWKIWNKIPSTNAGLKSSLVPILEESFFITLGPKAERYFLALTNR